MKRNSEHPTNDCSRHRGESVACLNENAIKKAVQKTHKLQKIIEAEMIEQLVPYSFHHSRLNDLIHNKVKTLYLHEGLALAHVLNAFMADFINEDILKLGSFDIKLIKAQEAFKKEQQCSNIISVHSSFPRCLYLRCATNQERLQYFQSNQTEIHEFYPLENVLNFLFSPISTLQHFQRINIIDNFFLLFEKANPKNTLQFFTHHPDQTSNIQFFINDALIYLDLPFSNNILAIKNKVIFDEMLNDFQQNQSLKITTCKESLELLKLGKALLESHCYITCNQIKQFYNDVSPHLKELLPKIRS